MDDYFGFILHYLKNRKKAYGIDAPVRSIMGAHDINITKLEIDGYLIDGEKYDLTPKGAEIASNYFKEYKEKNSAMYAAAADLIRSGRYMDAYLLRAKRYCEWVIPPGIGSEWSNTALVKERAQKVIDHIKEIDFSDLDNSIAYKEMFFNIAVYADLSESFDVDIFESTEKINCAGLELFLKKRNAIISEHNKKFIYLITKIARNNIESTNRITRNNLSTTFNEGWNVSDGWVQMAHDMLEYENMEKQNIPGFPKTFKTYQKHKEANSGKYQSWITYAKEVDHGKD